MNKQRLGPYILATFALGWAAFAQAGGVGTTGGGYAVVCRDLDKTITSATVLDLYEAMHRDHLTLLEPAGTLIAEYERFLNRLRRSVDDPRPFSKEDHDQFIGELETNYTFLPSGTVLTPTGDTGSVSPIEEGCGLEQLAVYDDGSDQIFVNTDIWVHLDSVNRMALVGHEQVYHTYRLAGAKTSFNARRVIGEMLTTTPPPRVREGVPAANAQLECWASIRSQDQSYFIFHAYENPDKKGESIWQFVRVNGLDTLSLTRIQVPFVVKTEELGGSLFSEITPGSKDLYPDMTTRYYIHSTFPVESGVFKDFKIGVQYQTNKPFTVSLISPQNELIGAARVTSCSPKITGAK
jgi:hypothetical protein